MILKYFSTPVCGPCKMFKPIMQEVTSELGITVHQIDASIDSNSVNQYGVTAVPTMIITDDIGNPIRRHTGVMSKQQVKQFING